MDEGGGDAVFLEVEGPGGDAICLEVEGPGGEDRKVPGEEREGEAAAAAEVDDKVTELLAGVHRGQIPVARIFFPLRIWINFPGIL